MFQRVCYKKLAKKQLKGRRFTAVVAVFISLLLLMLVGSITNFSESSSQEFSKTENIAFIEETSSEYYFKSFETSTSPLDEIAFLLNLAILGITEVALCHLFNVYFCKPEEKILFGEFLKGFSLWLKGFLSILWVSLWTFLWSLLFIIPGIVKGFSYSQCFMIIAENPGISVRKALKISKTMTDGFKSDLFVMFELYWLGNSFRIHAFYSSTVAYSLRKNGFYKCLQRYEIAGHKKRHTFTGRF